MQQLPDIQRQESFPTKSIPSINQSIDLTFIRLLIVKSERTHDEGGSEAGG